MTVKDILLNRKYYPRSKPADVIKKEKELIELLEKLGKKYKISDPLAFTVELRHYWIGIFYENKERKPCLERVHIVPKRKRKWKIIWVWSKKGFLYDSEDSDRFFQKNNMNKIKEKAEKLIMEELLEKF